jgi:hypothetical protein
MKILFHRREKKKKTEISGLSSMALSAETLQAKDNSFQIISGARQICPEIFVYFWHSKIFNFC